MCQFLWKASKMSAKMSNSPVFTINIKLIKCYTCLIKFVITGEEKSIWVQFIWNIHICLATFFD